MTLFRLLFVRRFGPFFATQALGAFNDNLFRFTLMFYLTFQLAGQLPVNLDLLMNLAAGLFILPFFLFSALAGQLADKYEKALFIRRAKLLEALIMLLAIPAFWLGWWQFLLLLVFLMGAQSALFGPVKYALLPQQLQRQELVSGNALVSLGTFMAILLGTLLGGLLADWLGATPVWLGVCVFGVSLLGLLASLAIPPAAAGQPKLVLNFSVHQQTRKALQLARRHRGVHLAILAISWFWFMGSGYLTQFPSFTRTLLQANEQVATLLLTLFSLGVGLGALLCARWSRGRIELGLVPLGGLGISLCALLFAWQSLQFPALPDADDALRDLSGFWQAGGGWLSLTLLLLGLCGGLFIVPLYTYIQHKTRTSQRARMIAALNIINSLAMVLSAVSGILLLGILQLSLPVFFMVYGLTALLVTLRALQLARDPLLRFLVFLLSHSLYRVRHEGLEHIPEKGPALVVANHVSYMDALLLGGACQRPLRFVIDRDIHDQPLLRYLLQLAGTIPLSSERIERDNLQQAFQAIGARLQAGELVFIFPEGRLTRDGNIQPFKKGIERILQQYPVPVIPMALRGLWGSWFSHQGKRAFRKWPRRFWSPVTLVAGPPIPPQQATAALLQSRVAQLRGDTR